MNYNQQEKNFKTVVVFVILLRRNLIAGGAQNRDIHVYLCDIHERRTGYYVKVNKVVEISYWWVCKPQFLWLYVAYRTFLKTKVDWYNFHREIMYPMV